MKMPLFLVRNSRRLAQGALTLICVCLIGSLGSDGIVATTADGRVMRFSSVGQLNDYYERIGYTVEALQAGGLRVPRLYLTGIPGDWALGMPIDSKKSVFFRTLLPLVLSVNEEVLANRKRLEALDQRIARGGNLGDADRRWLIALADEYRLAERVARIGVNGAQDGGWADLIAELLPRVDGVPVSLALGQAAYESAYATSRFASEGNALFGQWAWGRGMLPQEQREALNDHRVAAFPSPRDSAVSYLRNLNTHVAYDEFRSIRARGRRQDEALGGYRLAETLARYSEGGADYVAILRRIIADNDLDRFDGLSLADGQSAVSLSVALNR